MTTYKKHAKTHYQNDELPGSLDVEAAVLGTLLMDNLAAYPEIRDILKPEHFFGEVHQKLAERIFGRSRRGQVCDAIILKQMLQQSEDLVDVGGVEYIALMLSNAALPAILPEYAKLIADLAGRRELIFYADSILKSVKDPDTEETAEDMANRFASELSVVHGMFPSSATFVNLKDAAREAVEAIGQDRPLGIPTGFDEVDEKISGLGRGKLITIAGEPSMGKTSFVTNIVSNVARSIGVDEQGNDVPGKVGFFSQEMPALELGERAASRALGPAEGVFYQDIAKHAVTSSQKALLKAALPKVPDIWIDPTAGLTYSDLEKRARALEKKLGGLDVLVVDYLQLMTGGDSPHREESKFYGWIVKNLKTLAKKMNIAIILLSQLSRKVQERENRRPRKSDLKGTSAIEDASDIILFVFRPEVPLVEKGEPSNREQKEKYYKDLNWAKGRVQIIIGKNKGGPLGTIDLRGFMGYDVIAEYADEDGTGFDEEIPF